MGLANKGEKTGFTTIFLFTCVVVISGAMVLFAANRQRFGTIDKEVTAYPKVFIEKETIVSNSIYVTHDDMSQMMTSFETRVDSKINAVDDRVLKIDSYYKTLKRRQWLIGVAVNENANLSKRTDSKPQDYMTFDRHWKISKIPSTMTLTPEERQRLHKQLR